MPEPPGLVPRRPDFRIAPAAKSGNATAMRIHLPLLLLGLATLPANAQVAGANTFGGRAGGITFVTRRVPTSGVGVAAANLFTAGGVPVANPGAIAGSAGVGAPGLADVSPPPVITDAKVVAALRQSAARGNQDARRLLLASDPKTAGAAPGVLRRRR